MRKKNKKETRGTRVREEAHRNTGSSISSTPRFGGPVERAGSEECLKIFNIFINEVRQRDYAAAVVTLVSERADTRPEGGPTAHRERGEWSGLYPPRKDVGGELNYQ